MQEKMSAVELTLFRTTERSTSLVREICRTLSEIRHEGRSLITASGEMRAAGAVAPRLRWGAGAPCGRVGGRPPPRVRGGVRGIAFPRRGPGRAVLSKTKTNAAFDPDAVGTIVPVALDAVSGGSGALAAATKMASDLSDIAAAPPAAAAAAPSAASETLRVLGAAILDRHSVWWALASPLFALSVAPYLLFLKRVYDAPSATDEMRASFGTLLLFVVVSIPAEAYTQEAYGTVLSNIDALHFLIQAAISLTNLRVMLAFRDAVGREGSSGETGTSEDTFPPASNITTISMDAADGGGWDGEGWDGRVNSGRGASASVDWGGGGDGGAGGGGGGTSRKLAESAETFRPGQLVEAAAGLALVSTFGLMALDSRLVSLEDLGVAASSPAEAWVSGFRAAAAGVADALAPGLPAGPPNALSVPTWGVHVFSLVEWLVAMGLVWSYAETSANKGWRALTWGMLPLHASGVCACAQHFFFNAADLEWLVAAQGALTFVGNAGMCAAAGVIIEEDTKRAKHERAEGQDGAEESGTSRGSVKAFSAGSSSGSRDAAGDSRVNLSTYFADFDVENFATLWAGDRDATFATKIAMLSLIVAAIVRGASLGFGPYFADGGELQSARGLVAGVFVVAPFSLNVLKWRRREADAPWLELAASNDAAWGTVRIGSEPEDTSEARPNRNGASSAGKRRVDEEVKAGSTR